MEALPLGVLVGVLVGAVVGLVGAGGAIIAVPALVYLVGLPPEEAVPTSLLVVGLSAVAGALPRLRGGINWPFVLIIGLAGLPASWAGAAVGGLLDPNVLMLIFAAVMVLAGLRMLAKPPSGIDPFPASGWSRTAAILIRGISVGLLVGFLTGLLGVGGGFLIIPALTFFLGVPIRQAVGTSLVIVAINSASGFLAHLDGLSLDWTLTAVFAAAAVISSLAAARLAGRLNDRVVNRVFAGVVFAVAALVAVQSLAALRAAESESGTGLTADAGLSADAGLTASVAQSRMDIGQPVVSLILTNNTARDLRVDASDLYSPLLDGPSSWEPANPGTPTVLRTGTSVALPTRLAPPHCPDSRTDGWMNSRTDGRTDGGAAGPEVRLDTGEGRQRLAVADPHGTLADLAAAGCLDRAVRDVAALSPADVAVGPGGRTAVVHLRVDPAGGKGELTVVSFGTTPLLTEVPGAPWPRRVVIRGGDAPSVIELAVAPARCDPHALAEDKVGTQLPVEVVAGEHSGGLRLGASPEFTAEVHGFIADACGLGPGGPAGDPIQ